MSAQQNSVPALVIDNGLIAIDEHTTVSCMIHDVTATDLSLTLLEGAEIPGSFVLFVGSAARVCTIMRRSEEEIIASFADLTTLGRAAKIAIAPEGFASASGQRRAGQDRSLRRAA